MTWKSWNIHGYFLYFVFTETRKNWRFECLPVWNFLNVFSAMCVIRSHNLTTKHVKNLWCESVLRQVIPDQNFLQNSFFLKSMQIIIVMQKSWKRSLRERGRQTDRHRQKKNLTNFANDIVSEVKWWSKLK